MNQSDTIKAFVAKHIMHDVTLFVDYCLKTEHEVRTEAPIQFDDFINMYDEASDEYNECINFYAVSDAMRSWLEQEGEVVTDDEHAMAVWGRQEFGQAVLMDAVIQRIFEKHGA